MSSLVSILYVCSFKNVLVLNILHTFSVARLKLIKIRERETDRQRQRDRDRETDRDTERDRDRERDRAGQGCGAIASSGKTDHIITNLHHRQAGRRCP